MAQAKSDQASKRAKTTTSTKIQPTFGDTFEHMSNVCMFSVCVCEYLQKTKYSSMICMNEYEYDY